MVEWFAALSNSLVVFTEWSWAYGEFSGHICSCYFVFVALSAVCSDHKTRTLPENRLMSGPTDIWSEFYQVSVPKRPADGVSLDTSQSLWAPVAALNDHMKMGKLRGSTVNGRHVASSQVFPTCSTNSTITRSAVFTCFSFPHRAISLGVVLYFELQLVSLTPVLKLHL